MEELKFILMGLLIFIARVGFFLLIAGGLIGAAYWIWRRWQQRTAQPPASGPGHPPTAL